MDFKRKKDNALGGMMLAAQNQEKRVLIRKVKSSFIVVEFQYAPRISEIMETPSYDIQGEVVSSVPVKGETLQGVADWYNDHG